MKTCAGILLLLYTGLPLFCQTGPGIPQLERVTVIPQPGGEEYVGMSWDTITGDGYIIFRYEFDPLNGNYIWLGIDTIYDDMVTDYLDVTSLPGSKSESYRIGALDIGAVGNFSGAFGKPHATVFVQAAFDPCQGSLKADWTPYRGWDDSLDGYRIYLRQDIQPFILVNSTLVSDTFFTVQGLEAQSDYCLYVEAVHESGRLSRSNTTCLFTAMPRPPGYLNTDYVTATVDGIDLRFSIDPLTETTRYYILRKDYEAADYDTIHRVMDYSGQVIEYTDQAEVSDRWIYRLAALNECGRIVTLSLPAGNMVLEAWSSQLQNILSWNSYRQWLGGVDSYAVFRSTGTQAPVRIADLLPGDTSYTDDVSAFQNTELVGEFCYFIQAEEGPGNPYGIRGVSRSNRACISIEPRVFIPNAIVPGSAIPENRVFLPVFTFAPAEYHLVIYNRWNNKVFETSNYLEAWDGRLGNEHPTTEDSYIYFIRYRSASGKEHTRSGHITVLKQ